MAKGNMIITLVAQTKRFQDGLKDAGGVAQKFGAIVGGAMNLALGALGLLTSAVFFFLPNFIKMGEEARKSELRLGNVAKQMGQFGAETEIVTSRLSKYADTLSFATGVDDDLIRANEAILLTFSNLGISAKKAGGIFDRALVATLDLAATGFGTAESNAIQLGKALNDPVKGISALGEAGVTFTQVEKDKIKALVNSNRLLEAQEIVMKAVETQVGGTAVAIASATEKMNAKFEAVTEELSKSLQPAVDDIADAMVAWLDSVDGKKAISQLTDDLIEFGEWIASPDGKKAIDDLGDTIRELGNFARDTAGFFRDLKGVLDQVSQFNAGLFANGLFGTNLFAPAPRPTPTPAPALPRPADRITVNVSAITPTPVIGRTVMDSIKAAQRLGQR